MKPLKALLTVTALLAGCGQTEEQKAVRALACSPQTVTLDDVLTINLGTPHAGELAIVDPKGEFFFIAQRNPVAAIPSEVFKGMSTLQISVGTFMAHRWRAGAPDYEHVFNEPGTYKLKLGEPLESDSGTPIQTCEITLKK